MPSDNPPPPLEETKRPEFPSLHVISPDDDWEDVSEDEFDEDDESAGDDDSRTILITGASGIVGRKLRLALADYYDLVLIDDVVDPEVFVADLARWSDEWFGRFESVDGVIHIPRCLEDASADPGALIRELDVTSNVMLASVLGGVERVIYAGSLEAAGRRPDPDSPPIKASDQGVPDTPVGIASLMAERLGRGLASAADIPFVSLRLGLSAPASNPPGDLPDDSARRRWLSDRDLVGLVFAALEVELDKNDFVVVNALSANRGSGWDLEETAARLGYAPGDDAFRDDSESAPGA